MRKQWIPGPTFLLPAHSSAKKEGLGTRLAKSLLYNYCTQEYASITVPHYLKSVAEGKPVIMVPLVLFTDDTSGNKSKQWNKFDYWALRIAGLPIHENSMLHNIHFLCCSCLGQ